MMRSSPRPMSQALAALVLTTAILTTAVSVANPAVASPAVASPAVASPAVAASGREGLRLNQIQVIGTHNSYHAEATPAEEALRSSFDPVGELALEYGHPALADQLGGENVRQLELDLWADPAGGLFARPLIRDLLGEPQPYDPALTTPGFKVLHIQDIDYRSVCTTLVTCLRQLKAWSDGAGRHVPVAVLLELKDSPLTVPGVPLPFTVPVPWDGAQLDALDVAIRSVFRPRDLVTPDDVRHGRRTLEDAVLHRGWPTLAESRGKVLFLMDNSGPLRTAYLAGHPSLRGRVLFTNSSPGQPDAAFVEENDPTGAAGARITAEVEAGYVVRTRADADTVQARTGDTSQRDAALASGAQWVSTDYPVPGIAARFGTGYVAQLPGGVAVRCNPVSAPSWCAGRPLAP